LDEKRLILPLLSSDEDSIGQVIQVPQEGAFRAGWIKPLGMQPVVDFYRARSLGCPSIAVTDRPGITIFDVPS